MGSPSEPLLPVEPDRPPRLKLWISTGAAAFLLLGVALYWGLRRADPAPGESSGSGSEEPAAPPARTTDPTRKPSGTPRSESADERQARELYEAAEAF